MVEIGTLAGDWYKVRSVNATTTSLTAKPPVKAEPTGDAGNGTGASIIDIRLTPGISANAIKLIPYGTGDDNDVFVMSVLGWGCIDRGKSTQTWFSVILGQFTCTMSAYAGIALGALVATELVCDTIVGVTNKWNDDVTASILSPADDTPAHVTIDLEGFSKIEVLFDTTTGNPTGCNALYSLI